MKNIDWSQVTRTYEEACELADKHHGQSFLYNDDTGRGWTSWPVRSGTIVQAFRRVSYNWRQLKQAIKDEIRKVLPWML